MRTRSANVRIISRYVQGLTMPELKEPVVTLERVKITGVHLTSLDFEVTVKILNPNPADAVLRELPFTIFFQDGNREKEVASGNTGKLEIPAFNSTKILVLVTSHDLALIEALATVVETGGIRLEIRGNAVIDHIVGWTLPISETIDLTERQVLDALEGKK